MYDFNTSENPTDFLLDKLDKKVALDDAKKEQIIFQKECKDF